MAGTKAGGKAAAAKNKAKYGNDFYARIGARGGKKGHTGGFATRTKCTREDCAFAGLVGHHIAECAGRKGGLISRRTKRV